MKGAGGVVSFEVKGGLDAACRAVDRMTLARMAPSLGGVETLVEVPAVMSYYELTPDERARTGIAEGLVRLAVGIEDAEDILADLDRALASPAP
jgi:cystathionine gamma-synthase